MKKENGNEEQTKREENLDNKLPPEKCKLESAN